MGDDLVREETRGHRRVLIIDFSFLDLNGVQRRYRRAATEQSDRAAASAEAQTLHEAALKLGSPFGKLDGTTTFRRFYEETYKELSFPHLRPATKSTYEAMMGQGILK